MIALSHGGYTKYIYLKKEKEMTNMFGLIVESFGDAFGYSKLEIGQNSVMKFFRKVCAFSHGLLKFAKTLVSKYRPRTTDATNAIRSSLEESKGRQALILSYGSKLRVNP
ncbi:hypothetical protein QQP08_010968 [Theobroma cacao]|nr:hypothetical protein QQP08_010968 [Theobroma cacao]